MTKSYKFGHCWDNDNPDKQLPCIFIRKHGKFFLCLCDLSDDEELHAFVFDHFQEGKPLKSDQKFTTQVKALYNAIK